MSLVESGTLSDLPYAILMNDHLGTLCGYLGVPPNHPWYGQHSEWANDNPIDAIQVHGGVTFTGASIHGNQAEVLYLKRKMQESIKSTLDREEVEDSRLKDVVESGRRLSAHMVNRYEAMLDYEVEHAGEKNTYPIEVEADVWWVGFDCGHYMDAHDPEWLAKQPPQYYAIYSTDHGETFKDRDYVFNELEYLAKQAYEVAQADSARTGDRREA